MNEFYIRVHYYEYTDAEDDFVRFVVPKNVTQEQLFDTIMKVKKHYNEDEGGDILEITDDIMDRTAERLHGLWEYVSSCATIQMRYDE